MFDRPSPIPSSVANAYRDRQKMVRAAEITVSGSAENIAQSLYEAISKYQHALPDEDDVALKVVNFGDTATILVEHIGYIGDSLVVFDGLDNSDSPMELIQHISQLNFLLMVAPKPSVEAPKRRIGFVGEWNQGPSV